MARYAGLLLAPAGGFGLRPRHLLPFGQKKSLLCCFGPFFIDFWNPVVTLVIFSSNLSYFEKNAETPEEKKNINKKPKKKKKSFFFFKSKKNKKKSKQKQ